MFSDNNTMRNQPQEKLYTHTHIYTHTQNHMMLNNQYITEEVKEEIKKHLEKMKIKANNSKPMGYSKSSSKKEAYSNKILP